jgi:lipopolysaccharide/colanic/teichoic acid biosynthesis glycosyltransferase
MFYLKVFKPSFDFIIALFSFLLVSPLFLIVGITLFFANRGNPFFFQTRPGKHQKLFRVIKFKTMNDRTDKAGNLLPDAKRLTIAGKIIRKTSLDEIPQLINIIKGDMSLIGPRPLLVDYLPLYNEVQKRRHEVKPGITGWAQVNGRNAISWEQKFAYDVWYVDHLNPKLDFKIILMTLTNVLRAKGISHDGHATMPIFKGSRVGEKL